VKPIPLDVATRAAERLCRDASVALVPPGDPRREAVVLAMGAYHALRGTGWSLEHAREHVSVTLPGLGAALDVLAKVPVIGGALVAAVGTSRSPGIYLARGAYRDGATLLGVVAHELAHVGQLRRGGPLWCLAYGVVPEVVAGAESVCYVASCAHAVHLGGMSAEDAAQSALASLTHYGLDGASTDLAAGILAGATLALSRGVDPGGIVADSLAALAAEGWTP
jgi:hypothetical protein